MIKAQEIFKDIEHILMAKHFVKPKDAQAFMLENAIGEACINAIGASWANSSKKRAGVRCASYLSAEYLTGRVVYSNLLSLGILKDVMKLLENADCDLAGLEEVEDAALGNGGLGRLAACFLDSAANLSLPVNGYGLRYRFGLFKQQILNGRQAELPDDWTKLGDPWSVRRDEDSVTIHFADGDVRAVPYDMPIIGYKSNYIATLRLWQAESPNELDFDAFNSYKYAAASADKNKCEDITKVLYPNDWDNAGKILRLKQQYLLSSASLVDMLRRYEKTHKSYAALAGLNCIQLNDTHPVLAIPELIRLLMLRGVSFKCSVKYAKRMFAYTNHTVMPEALEKWDLKLISTILPEICAILKRIDRLCRRETGLDLIKDGYIHMAELAVYMGFSVNGVAKIHSELVKTQLFPRWYKLYPERFNNKTNGITPRRWLGLCNPELCAVLGKHTDGDFIKDLSLIDTIKKDESLIRDFIDVKQAKKVQLSSYIFKREGVLLPPDFVYDVQIKRLHEYKRQLLNALCIYEIYMQIKEGSLKDFPKTAFIFGAKAAPGYARAKAVIHYISCLADMINNDPDVNGRMRVCFVSNYNCTYAEHIIPAADLSEQISPAGTEASGTGNMKLMLNGAVTLGTFDGANIEIAAAAGLENEFIFGADIQKINELRSSYDPIKIYNACPMVKRAVDSLTDAGFEDADGALKELKDSLLIGASWHKSDMYYLLLDFESYYKARIKALRLAQEQKYAFADMCVSNILSAAVFSSDRTVNEYASEIWKIAPIKIR